MNAKSKELKKFRDWLRQVLNWLAHGVKSISLYVLLGIILFAIVYFDSSIASCKEKDIRWIGLLFQVAGFTIVVLQMDTLRKLFRKPSFFSRIKNYWRSFPSPYIRTVSISAHAVGGVASLSASLSVRPAGDATLERRIEFLESEIEDLRRHMQKTDRNLTDYKAESEKSLNEVRGKIKEGDNRLEQLIDKAFVGGIDLEWVGILYFVVGVVLATASSDISLYLGACRI